MYKILWDSNHRLNSKGVSTFNLILTITDVRFDEAILLFSVAIFFNLFKIRNFQGFFKLFNEP